MTVSRLAFSPAADSFRRKRASASSLNTRVRPKTQAKSTWKGQSSRIKSRPELRTDSPRSKEKLEHLCGGIKTSLRCGATSPCCRNVFITFNRADLQNRRFGRSLSFWRHLLWNLSCRWVFTVEKKKRVLDKSTVSLLRPPSNVTRAKGHV